MSTSVGDEKRFANPEISVIVPVHHTEQYLNKCLDSIYNQDFGDFEVMLVASGKDTASMDICKEYERRDSRTRLIDIPPTGPSERRNAGLSAAAGKYVMFIDSDDYIMPGMFSAMYRLAEENGLEIGICNAYRTLENQSPRDVWFNNREVILKCPKASRRDMMLTWNITSRNSCVWNKIYLKSFLDNNSIRFPNKIMIGEDSLFSNNCFSRTRAAGAINEPYYVYVNHAGSLVYSVMMPTYTTYIKAYWELLNKNMDGAEQSDEILAYCAVRLFTAANYVCKNWGYSVEETCDYIYRLISEMNFLPYLRIAANPRAFDAYVKTCGMKKEEAANYLEFINSLCGGKESMITWQNKFSAIYGKGRS